jgi:hypothetical protein
MISGVLDGPLPGGYPKMIELYALGEVTDLSAYGIGIANNGGGTDGEEFELSGTAAAGSFVTVAYESAKFAEYFGEAPVLVSRKASFNGDDAIELFFDGAVVDVFGDSGVDGTNQAWEYMDGWAYRRAGSVPSSSFQIGEWTFSEPNALDGCTSNIACGSSFPLMSFGAGSSPPPTQSPSNPPSQQSCECLYS